MGETVFSYNVRPGCVGDLAFVSNSWLRGIQRNTYFASRIPSHVFWDGHHPIVERLLERSQLFVAHPSEPETDLDTILGWLAVERRPTGRPILHWVYVRSAWRGIGIARRLVAEAALNPVECVFPVWSFDCNTLVKRFPAEFNPYLHFER